MSIRIINRQTHAILDYATGIGMLAAPWIFGLADHIAARNMLLGAGVFVIMMSSFTNYEGGASKKIAMSTHLWGDLSLGIFLAASPWLFFFNDQTYGVHVAFGLLAVVVSLLTITRCQLRKHGPLEPSFRRKPNALRSSSIPPKLIRVVKKQHD